MYLRTVKIQQHFWFKFFFFKLVSTFHIILCGQPIQACQTSKTKASDIHLQTMQLCIRQLQDGMVLSDYISPFLRIYFFNLFAVYLPYRDISPLWMISSDFSYFYLNVVQMHSSVLSSSIICCSHLYIHIFIESQVDVLYVSCDIIYFVQ